MIDCLNTKFWVNWNLNADEEAQLKSRGFKINLKMISAVFAVTFQTGFVFSQNANASSVGKSTNKKDFLVRFVADDSSAQSTIAGLKEKGISVDPLTDEMFRLQASASKLNETLIKSLHDDSNIDFIQPNLKIGLIENYQIQDSLKRAAFLRALTRQSKNGGLAPTLREDNLELPANPPAQRRTDIIVAVIDSGVDYTHPSLAPALWTNTHEIPGNGIDDDHNGFVDDVIGWDFTSDDSRPYDFSVDPLTLLTEGGNPGHGTHVAGSIAMQGLPSDANSDARTKIEIDASLKIMPLRVISERGSGTTSDAVKAIHYAVDNGAQIISAAWGFQQNDAHDDEINLALTEAIEYAKDHGVLIVFPAGDGARGWGRNIDDEGSTVASLKAENLITVAALDSEDKLADFSDWGAQTVELAAPGVAIRSTTVLGDDDDHVINVGGFEVTWDGTSMASAQVSGAMARYWQKHPSKTWGEVKKDLLATVRKYPSLKDKVLTEGVLDFRAFVGN